VPDLGIDRSGLPRNDPSNEEKEKERPRETRSLESDHLSVSSRARSLCRVIDGRAGQTFLYFYQNYVDVLSVNACSLA